MQSLVPIIVAIGGALVLLWAFARLRATSGFPTESRSPDPSSFFAQLGGMATSYVRFVSTFTKRLLVAATALAGGWLISTWLNWQLLGSVFLGLTMSVLAAVAIVWRPFAIALDGAFRLAPGLRERIQAEMRWVLGLFFWIFAPALILAFLPRTTSPGLIFCLVLLGIALTAGATAGIFPLPVFFSPRLIRWKLQSLFILTVLSLYIPTLPAYIPWLGSRFAGWVTPESKPLPASAVVSENEWFTVTGTGRYYFCKTKDREYLVYPAPGFSPQTGQRLEEVNSLNLVNDIKSSASYSLSKAAKLHADENTKKLAKFAWDEEVRKSNERQRLIAQRTARYLNTEIINTSEKIEIGLLVFESTHEDIREQVIMPSFEACNTQKLIFLPGALNVRALSDDGLIDRMWTDDLTGLSAIHLDQHLDFVILVKAVDEVVKSTVEASLRSFSCHETIKLYSTAPLHSVRTIETSVTVPAFSRQAAFPLLRERLANEVSKNVTPLLEKPQTR